jgi:hypothetical protein
VEVERVEEVQHIRSIELVEEVQLGVWEWVRRRRCRGLWIVGRQAGPDACGAVGVVCDVIGSEWSGEGVGG